MVFKALVKNEVDQKVVVTPRIKKGKSFFGMSLFLKKIPLAIMIWFY